MRAPMPSSRSLRALVLLTCATVVAAGFVLIGAGPAPQAHAAVSPGTTQLVSVDTDQNPVDQNITGQDSTPFTGSAGSGQAAISADGRYVAFATFTSFDPLDLRRETDSNLDVYVRDLQEQRTVLLSQGVLPPPANVLWLNGPPGLLAVPADGHSGNPSISADGRYVAFQTTANNLGAPDHDLKSDVVVVDRDPDADGVLDETDCSLQLASLPAPCNQVTQVSPDWFDTQGRPVAEAATPSISAAGDAVSWVGVSLAEQNNTGTEAEQHRGVPVVYHSTLERAPTGAITAVRSQQVNAQAEGLLVRGENAPALSGDGRRLVLVAQTVSLSEGGEQISANSAVLGVDLSAAPLEDTGGEGYATTRLDVDESGSPLSLPAGFDAAPALSGDGRLVTFTAPATGFPVVRTVVWETEPDPEPTPSDPQPTLPPTPQSTVVSTDTTGNPIHGSDPALSADGRYLAFTTSARNTHNGFDGPETSCAAAESTSSPTSSPTPSQPLPPTQPTSTQPQPPSTQPQPPDPATPSHCDVVVRDLALDQVRAASGLPRLPAELASPSLTQSCLAEPTESPEESPEQTPEPAAPPEEDTADTTCEGDDASGYPALSADGGVVAYESKATTLTPQDRNGRVQDVFARTFTPSLTADPLDFFTIEPGNSTIGSTTLRHVGFGPLPVESMTISGVHAADFTVDTASCLETVLHAGQTCPASVRFTPSDLGSREAALEVRYRGGESPLIVPLLATAALAPPQAVTFTPEPLTFGDILPLSTSAPADVTVANTGSAPLTISALGIPTDVDPVQHPEDYQITKEDCTGRTLRPGESCLVTLQFSPQGVGERPAVLRIEDNAPNAPHLLPLQGIGVQPTLRFDPDVVQEGRVTTLIGSGFAPQRNVTIQLPDISGPVTITPDDAGNFTTSVVILENTTPGERRADATIDEHQPPITATANLLVVARPAGPPRGPR